MTGKSEDILKNKIKDLKKLFPEVITEGKVDFEQLKATLGSELNTENERYVLNWAGKSEAFKILQQPTTATLAPAPKESVDFNNTENIFIEGENLEVLKVLQKSYYGKIKMIYIDPPYNTGNDSFIYPDKFSESKEEYLKRIGEKDEEGYLLKEGLFRKNSKENGQFHSVWLSMMYPRLFLARNLLRDDGVIFISIDDNEVHNLRMVMNEIFGEENFVAQLIWQKGAGTQNDNKYIAESHEYILCYAKSLENTFFYNLPPSEEMLKNYNLVDEFVKTRGKYTLRNLDDFSIGDRPGLHYDIICPDGKVLKGKEHRWRCDQERYNWRTKEKRIVFDKNKDGEWDVLYKQYINEKKEEIIKDESGNILSYGKIPDTLLLKVALTGDGSKDIKEIFSNKHIFTYPKPVDLLKHILTIQSKNDDIILDFFSGSCPVAQAVIELNIEDGGSRKFICVQLPEKCEEESEAFKAGYKTISEIGKERIRRVIKRIKQELKENKDLFSKDKSELDLGLKVYKIKESNFKVWRSDVIEGKEDLGKQLDMFQDPVKPGAEMNNMMWELLVKSGYELTTKVEEREISKCPVFIIADGELVICLSKLTETAVKEILKLKPKKVICLDSLFEKNDKLKTNTALQMKDAGVEFKTI